MAKRLILEKGFSIFRKHQAITGMRSLYTCSTAMQVFSCYTRISHTPLCLTSSAYQRVNIIQPVWLGSGSLVRKNSNFTRSPLYLHSQTSYDTWKYKRHTRVWPFYLSPGRSYRPSVTYLYLLMIAGAWPIELCTPCIQMRRHSMQTFNNPPGKFVPSLGPWHTRQTLFKRKIVKSPITTFRPGLLAVGRPNYL